MLVGAMILMTAALIVGGGLMIGLGLRKFYKAEGSAFAAWHKPRMLRGLAWVTLPLFAILWAILAGSSMEIPELTLIGSGLTVEVIWASRRLSGRSRRGSPLGNVRTPEARPDRVGLILTVVAAGFFVAAMVIDATISIVGIARLVGLAGAAFAAVLIRPITHQLYEGGVQDLGGLVPWDRLESFRYIAFERTAVFFLQLRTPGWFRKEVAVTVQREDIEQVRGLLSGRLPCLGVQDHHALFGATSP